MRVLVPVGTRPEIVKLAPVVSALRRRAEFQVRVVATGQHYDDALVGSFFRELGFAPDDTWELPSGEAERIGRMLTLAFSELERNRPDLVLVLGDTYTVPIFCIAARRHQLPIVHLEAGIRSFNETSMEEVNRRVAAATASLHLAPTALAGRFLEDEGIPHERIRVIGNPVTDVLRLLGVTRRPLDERSGVALTVHRASNVDSAERLELVVRGVELLADHLAPVTFPVHPRTRSRLEARGLMPRLRRDGVRLLEPLPYHAMLDLLGRSRVIVTDSGGLQEEASWLGVPVVVLRRSTPRWEGVKAGAAVLTGVDPERVLEAALRLAEPDEQARVAALPSLYGDGHAAEAVVELLLDPATAELLRWRELAAPPALLTP